MYPVTTIMLMLEHRVDLVLLVQKSLFCQAFIIMYFWVVVDYMCMHAQLCLTLCNPMYCSLPGSSVYGIFQARILECCSKELRTKYWFAQQIQFVHFHIFQSQKISHFTMKKLKLKEAKLLVQSRFRKTTYFLTFMLAGSSLPTGCEFKERNIPIYVWQQERVKYEEMSISSSLYQYLWSMVALMSKWGRVSTPIMSIKPSASLINTSSSEGACS